MCLLKPFKLQVFPDHSLHIMSYDLHHNQVKIQVKVLYTNVLINVNKYSNKLILGKIEVGNHFASSSKQVLKV